jgi:hypothetical protein
MPITKAFGEYLRPINGIFILRADVKKTVDVFDIGN